jgi:hypothetical protein
MAVRVWPSGDQAGGHVAVAWTVKGRRLGIRERKQKTKEMMLDNVHGIMDNVHGIMDVMA